jgi:predicted nucleic acid-binding Zn ribbon protein
MSDRRRRDLEPLSKGLDDILTKLGLPPDLGMASMVEEWPEVAGEPFGSLSRPAGYSGGELTLSVADGASATLLRYRITELVERLDRQYGKGRVTSIRIIVGGSKNAS